MVIEYLTTVVEFLIQEYGVVGALFVIIISVLARQNKKCGEALGKATDRIGTLEERADKSDEGRIEDHKKMLEDYIILVREKNDVISKLTSCLDKFRLP